MGVSTDAVLFFGICWDEEGESRPWRSEAVRVADDRWLAAGNSPAEDPEDYDAFIARMRGVIKPANFDEDTDAKSKERRAYYAQCRDVVAAEKCVIGVHCSNSSPMVYIALRESLIVASRGCPEQVIMATHNAWPAQLAEFCKAMGIETDKEPRWWLVSFWEE